uniref:Uncharacterized protein n=1 Tax=Arundo donax TaxID=35708 RepID=A0A0A8YJF7_ARUDO
MIERIQEEVQLHDTGVLVDLGRFSVSLLNLNSSYCQVK